jgi:PAS domain S-box-containing protein
MATDERTIERGGTSGVGASPSSGAAAGAALFAHGPVPMLLFDPATLDIVDANAAAQRHYGYGHDEFTRLTLRDLRLPGEAPSGLGQMPREPDGRVVGGPFHHRRRDGAMLEVEVHVQDLEADGRPLRLAILRDVTARRRGEQRERFLSAVSSVLAGSLDRQRTLERIADLAVTHLADGCAVHLHDPARGPDGLALLTVASRDPERAALLRELERRAADGDGTSAPGPAAALRSGRARLYQLGGADDGLPPAWRQLGIHSALCVPLAASGTPFGVVSLASLTAGRQLDEADLAMAEELAHHAALALESARLYDAERTARRLAERLAERTARLQALTAALAGALSPEDVTTVVVTMGIAALGARAGSIALLAEDGLTLEIVQATGYDPATVAAFRRMRLDAPLPLCDAVRNGCTVWLPTLAERDARYPHLASLRSAERGGALAAVPLVVEGRALGALGLNFHTGDALEEDDRSFVQTLAHQCAQALERSRLYAAERRARAAIEAARLEAEAANRTKTEFLAIMSHELRTPLNAIAGYVELLEMGLRGPLTEAQRQDLSRIQRAQRHLLGLINDVLNFAKLETGNVRYDITDVTLREAIEAVEPLIAPQLAQRGLRFALTGCTDGVTVRADRDKLQQILLNLLSNAVKFTERGGAVEVSGEAEGAVARLRVRDTGGGIPPERQASVFEPFVQLDQRLTRTSEGTGLGLAISRDLARAMDGDLTVESEVGVGSVFTVTLPRGAG